MATLAAPHPSFFCLMNGTSSQKPGVAAKTTPQRHKTHKSLCGVFPPLKTVLADGHDNQHQHRDTQDDEDQIAFAKIAGGKVSLRLVSPGGQLGQLLIVEC